MTNEEIKLWVGQNYYRTDGKPNSNFGRLSYCSKNEIYLDFYNSVIESTKWLDDHSPKFNDRVRAIIFDKTQVELCVCGSSLKLNWSLSEPSKLFNSFCSSKCAKNSDDTKAKYASTCMNNYGVSNASQHESIARKISNRLTTPFDVAVVRFKHHYGSRFDYTDNSESVGVYCKKHNLNFDRPLSSLLSGETNCPSCRADSLRDKYQMTTDEFVKRLSDVRGTEFTLVGEYFGMGSISTFMCDKGHTFDCKADHIVGTNKGNCPYCYVGSSKQEQDFIAYIKSISDDVIVNSRKHLGNGKEIDAVVKDRMFEFNGLYWHSSKFVNNTYHLEKTSIAEQLGYQLFHVWSHEWLDDVKRDIWKSIIKNSLKMADRRLHARKCDVRDVPYSEYETFMDENHIQGFSNAKYRLGLYYKNELVSCMGFSKPRFDTKCDFELVRFANAKYTSVVGGASKLLKQFTRANVGKSIVSYADRRLSSGNLYVNLGFKFSHHSPPSYFYTNDGINTVSRYSTQRKNLPKLLKNFDPLLSETQNMNANNFWKVYDCGTSVWILV